MLRLILLAVIVVLAAFVIYRIVRSVQSGTWDWRGIGISVVLVIAAFWLRQETGLGGLFG